MKRITILLARGCCGGPYRNRRPDGFATRRDIKREAEELPQAWDGQCQSESPTTDTVMQPASVSEPSPVTAGGFFVDVTEMVNSLHFARRSCQNLLFFCTKTPLFFTFWPRRFFPLCLFYEQLTRRHTMTDGQIPDTTKKKEPKVQKKNPFASGFTPTGKRRANYSTSYLTKKSLLKTMLEVDLTIQDLPTKMADELRNVLPGWFDNVERKFNMRQIMELVQFQLLFSKSDYVKQDAIKEIKDRVDGKAVQKVQVEQSEAEPTEIVLPGGRKIII